MLGQLHRSLTGLLVGIALSAIAGCGSSEPAVQKTEQVKKENSISVERKLPLKEYEATLNPSDFDQTVEVVQREHETEKPQESLEIRRDSTVVEEVVSQGFRIQIFSSSSIDEATDAKLLAIGTFAQDSVYLLYDAPVYKVRIGDFVSRYEASQKLPDAVELGYRDAWIVPDRIVQRKIRIVAPAVTPH